jgi:DNA-binding GntR family transcriptional regulator
VREALRKLEAEELVIRSSSGFSVVAERTLEDMLQAFHVRIALECYSVRLATASASDEQLSRLREFGPEIHSMGEKDEFEGKKQRGAHFHQAIVELTGNARIAKLLNDIIEYTDLYRQRLYREPQFLDENLVNHRQILEAMRSRDEDQAASLMREHLSASMEIVRTLWEQDHRPELHREEVEVRDHMR